MEHFLGRYDKYLVVPQGSNVNRPAFRIESVDPRFFGSASASTKLMLSPSLYGRFADYKYILLCHLDALVLSDRLDEWCDLDLDYIGAPWITCGDSPYVGVNEWGMAVFLSGKSRASCESSIRISTGSNRTPIGEACVYRKSGLSRYLSLPKRYLKSFSVFNGARQQMASWYLRADGRQKRRLTFGQTRRYDTTLRLE